MSDEASGTNCTSGGKQVNVGLDVNLSGVLDPAEITSTSYVCNGAAGATGAGGLNSLISSAIEPTGANCPYGGIKTTSGLDSNADGVLTPQKSAARSTSAMARRVRQGRPVRLARMD